MKNNLMNVLNSLTISYVLKDISGSMLCTFFHATAKRLFYIKQGSLKDKIPKKKKFEKYLNLSFFVFVLTFFRDMSCVYSPPGSHWSHFKTFVTSIP